MRLAYIVSRFPHASETFIARELLALEAAGEDRIELLSLFPPVDATVHASAAPFADRLVRPRVRDAPAALAWWAARRPLRLPSSTGVGVRAHARTPRVLPRALATSPPAPPPPRPARTRRIPHR